MRWPLRNQILLPMVGLMLATLIGVSFLNAYLSVRRTRSRITEDLAQVTETLTKTNFPLTDGVLQQMSGLVGAEFVLADEYGGVIASSSHLHVFSELPAGIRSQQESGEGFGETVSIADRRFFHSGVALRRLSEPAANAKLHIFYPEESYRQAQRDAVYPPLAVGAAAIVLVIGFGLGIASRVTQPLRRLQGQVDEIAEGNFQAVPVSARDDEIADLGASVNRMAGTLKQYETEIRRSEKLRTLGQLGGGIAHQMRNSVTGCRIAVELHARDCQTERESLDVAIRQLDLMEKFLQRFLSLGSSEAKPHTLVQLIEIVENVLALVHPTAQHVGVALEWTPPDESIAVNGDADALEQLLVNLVINGVEAASEPHQHGDSRQLHTPTVIVSLQRVGERVELCVEDSGRGPAVEVEADVFEPFVTEKPDGTGLGLAVAQDVAAAHGGDIHWCRYESMTRFIVTLATQNDSTDGDDKQ